MKIVFKILYKIYLWGSISIPILILSTILIFLFKKGVYDINFMAIDQDGASQLSSIVTDLLPPIAGTIAITLFSVVIATPIGIILGICINEYSGLRSKKFLIFLFKLLAGVPSIVVGVFGFIIILLLNSLFDLNLRTSFLISGLALSILIVPYIVHSTILGLSQVDKNIRDAALSLGAKKYQLIFRTLIPSGFNTIFSGIILAIGRACEDTAVIMLTGAAAYSGFPTGVFKSYEALPFYIFYNSAEYQNQFELNKLFIATIVIILISSSMIFSAELFKKKVERRLTKPHK